MEQQQQEQKTVKHLYAKRTGEISIHRSSSRSSSSDNNNNNTSTTTFRAPGEARPCSEKEMKALMSMFCELMGLQMNTDRLNQVSQYQRRRQQKKQQQQKQLEYSQYSQGRRHSNKKQRVVATTTRQKKLFHFPDDVPPPPGGWPDDLLWPSSATGSGNKQDAVHHDNVDSGDDDDDDDDDSLAGLPVLEDIPDRKMFAAAATRFHRHNNSNAATVTEEEKEEADTTSTEVVSGVKGIAPYEWDAIERMAVEDALEHEERIRKRLTTTATTNTSSSSSTTSKSHNKSSSSQQQQQQQSSSTSTTSNQQQQQQQDLERARQKEVMTWKNRVVAAFQRESQGLPPKQQPEGSSSSSNGGGETTTTSSSSSSSSLQALLDHSPVVQQQLQHKDDSNTHMLQAFLPLILPKHHHLRNSNNNNQDPPRGKDARDRLAAYLIAWHINILLIPSTNQRSINQQNCGRSVLQSACWLGDTDLVTAVVHHWTAMNEQQEENKKSSNATATTTTEASSSSSSSSTKSVKQFAHQKVPILDHPCHESGWAPLHYAAVSGSVAAVEFLLQHGCRVDVATNHTLTWSRETGKGVTALALVQAILQNQHESKIETHGMALQQVQKEFLKQQHHTAERYKAMLRYIEERLKQVEKDGYATKSYAQVKAELEELEENLKQQQRKQEQEEKARKKSEEVSTSAVSAAATSTKRNRKKKKVQDENKKASASVDTTTDAVSSAASNKTSSDVSKQSSQQRSSTQQQQTEDPLVTALLGMGFERKQIESGIQSCGPTRATADDIVAWIFGQAEGSNKNKSNSAAAFSSKSQERKPNVPTVTAATTTKTTKGWNDVSAKKRETALKRQEEDRLALERQAAKREEQRRRNREWNKRTQQLQQATTTPAVARAVDVQTFPQKTSTERYSAAASGAAKSNVGGTSTTVAKPPSRSRKDMQNSNAGEVVREAADGDTWNMNEVSTVGSLEHRTIEIIHNDDSTISTLGSAQARGTPVASQAPLQPSVPPGSLAPLQPSVPPGFAAPSNDTQFSQTNPWELQYNPTNNATQPEGFLPRAMEPNFGPPGMHESSLLMAGQLHTPAPPGLGSNTLAANAQPAARFSDPYSSPAVGHGFPSGGSSLMERTMPTANTSEAAPRGLFPSNGLPGMGRDPFRDSGHTGMHPPVDSSLIDSISTARLGDASLWGDMSAVGSSRFVGNVIGNVIPTDNNNTADRRKHGTDWGHQSDTVPRGSSIW